jgi:hypothetical protein
MVGKFVGEESHTQRRRKKESAVGVQVTPTQTPPTTANVWAAVVLLFNRQKLQAGGRRSKSPPSFDASFVCLSHILPLIL